MIVVVNVCVPYNLCAFSANVSKSNHLRFHSTDSDDSFNGAIMSCICSCRTFSSPA